MKEGDPIEYVTDHLGTLESPRSTKFAAEVQAGHRGVYVEPATWIDEPDWHLTKTLVGDLLRYVPVHRSMFRVIREGK